MAVTISLNQLGKRYRNDWIFRNIDYTFVAGATYAILGANGSGKSTLLRIIAGMQHPNKGQLKYLFDDKKEVNPESIHEYVAYAAPGMELIEEMTLKEFLHFHFTFKKPWAKMSVAEITAGMGLERVQHKRITEYSSGMKQRVKLAQAFFSDCPLLLLDEPCSNLDAQGVALYQSWLQQYTNGRTVIIASNDSREYETAMASFSIEDYK
jgi:ABC-type multidrug transport system ATPase subunit